jgi:hypothetical protein
VLSFEREFDMKKAEYKVASGAAGFKELEETVSKMLNEGWKPVGGIGFNAGFPYQAMARVVTVSALRDSVPPQLEEEGNKPVGAQAAMRRVDELT